jgi:uncharacterized protein (DUF362 family)
MNSFEDMVFFVDIEPLFSGDRERTVERLKEYYRRSEALQMMISAMLERHGLPAAIRGRRVLMKPNWVIHSRRESDDWCIRTSHDFLLAALRAVLSCAPERVLIGDAPIQGCHWDQLVTPSFSGEVNRLGHMVHVPVEIRDFRRKTFEPWLNNPVTDRYPLSEYAVFDTGESSYLEPVTLGGRTRFRVTDHDPRVIEQRHTPGRHLYTITKALFDYDVVISLPKVKTHQKVGLTAAVKNLVGLVGDKEGLPHHRLGGSLQGGDSYAGGSRLRFMAELASDFADRRQGKPLYRAGSRLSDLFMRLVPGEIQDSRGAWPGNDTTWRMVLDLNKIALFGTPDGQLAPEPQRVLYSLCDGIIAGEGDGPLKSLPLALGVLSLTNHSGMNDIALATLMGMDPERLPLLQEAASLQGPGSVHLTWNNQEVSLEDLRSFHIKASPPPGWEVVFYSSPEP